MLTFDENGYIIPDEPIIVDYETFVREFVVNDHRAEIFSEYRSMLQALSGLLDGNFCQRICSDKFLEMEIKDSRYIEIFHTLEKIDRLNKAIHFHRAIEGDVDELAIEQYSRMKTQLTEQLLQLLEDMDLHLNAA